MPAETHYVRYQPPQGYIIGSLRNPDIPHIANAIRDLGLHAFDDWWSASEDADEWWQNHEKIRGRTYKEALNGAHATNVFEFDLKNIEESSFGVLVLPAGKSGHMEMGYMRGEGKPIWIYFDGEPDRFDIMYRFAYDVCFSLDELLASLKDYWSTH